MALPVLMNIKQVIEQRQCSGVWTHKDELPVSPFGVVEMHPSLLCIISEPLVKSCPVCLCLAD